MEIDTSIEAAVKFSNSIFIQDESEDPYGLTLGYQINDNELLFLGNKYNFKISPPQHRQTYFPLREILHSCSLSGVITYKTGDCKRYLIALGLRVVNSEEQFLERKSQSSQRKELDVHKANRLMTIPYLLHPNENLTFELAEPATDEPSIHYLLNATTSASKLNREVYVSEHWHKTSLQSVESYYQTKLTLIDNDLSFQAAAHLPMLFIPYAESGIYCGNMKFDYPWFGPTILYGPPGIGKSTIIAELSTDLQVIDLEILSTRNDRLQFVRRPFELSKYHAIGSADLQPEHFTFLPNAKHVLLTLNQGAYESRRRERDDKNKRKAKQPVHTTAEWESQNSWDYIIVNDDIQESLENIKAIMKKRKGSYNEFVSGFRNMRRHANFITYASGELRTVRWDDKVREMLELRHLGPMITKLFPFPRVTKRVFTLGEQLFDFGSLKPSRERMGRLRDILVLGNETEMLNWILGAEIFDKYRFILHNRIELQASTPADFYAYDYWDGQIIISIIQDLGSVARLFQITHHSLKLLRLSESHETVDSGKFGSPGRGRFKSNRVLYVIDESAKIEGTSTIDRINSYVSKFSGDLNDPDLLTKIENSGAILYSSDVMSRESVVESTRTRLLSVPNITLINASPAQYRAALASEISAIALWRYNLWESGRQYWDGEQLHGNAVILKQYAILSNFYHDIPDDKRDYVFYFRNALTRYQEDYLYSNAVSRIKHSGGKYDSFRIKCRTDPTMFDEPGIDVSGHAMIYGLFDKYGYDVVGWCESWIRQNKTPHTFKDVVAGLQSMKEVDPQPLARLYHRYGKNGRRWPKAVHPTFKHTPSANDAKITECLYEDGTLMFTELIT